MTVSSARSGRLMYSSGVVNGDRDAERAQPFDDVLRGSLFRRRPRLPDERGEPLQESAWLLEIDQLAEGTLQLFILEHVERR